MGDEKVEIAAGERNSLGINDKELKKNWLVLKLKVASIVQQGELNAIIH